MLHEGTNEDWKRSHFHVVRNRLRVCKDALFEGGEPGLEPVVWAGHLALAVGQAVVGTEVTTVARRVLADLEVEVWETASIPTTLRRG